MEKYRSISSQLRQTLADYKEDVAAYIIAHPAESYEAIARKQEVSHNWIYRLVRARGLRRRADRARKVNNG